MKVATRKQEIKALETYFTGTAPSTAKAKATIVVRFAEYLDHLEAAEKLQHYRTFAFMEKIFEISKQPPTYEEMYYFLIDLKLGWRKYFAGCNHHKSLFFKSYSNLAESVTCPCCLFWRGRLIQIAIDFSIFAMLTYTLVFFKFISFNFT